MHCRADGDPATTEDAVSAKKQKVRGKTQKKMRTVLGGIGPDPTRAAGTLRNDGTIRLTSKDRAQSVQIVRGAVITYLQQNFHDGRGRGDHRKPHSRSFLDAQLRRLKACKFPQNKSIRVLGERYAERLRASPVNLVLVRVNRD